MTQVFFEGLAQKAALVRERERTKYAEPFETERLLLRPFAAGDLEEAMAFYASDRGRWHGVGPSEGVGRAWRMAATLLGHWQIHNYGTYTLVEKATRTCIGAVGIFHPEDWPEPELGWSIWTETAEGRGFAHEAAQAVLQRYLRDFNWPTLVSYIDPENARSIALALRLGAELDTHADRPNATCHVFRHKLNVRETS
ncbi:MAG: GNAT family N-acetyltransferase [Pseudomonadota bacterium]